jgi:hypothetical protein
MTPLILGVTDPGDSSSLRLRPAATRGGDGSASAATTSGSAPRSIRPGRSCSGGAAPSSPDIEQIDRLLPVGIDEFERDSKD